MAQKILAPTLTSDLQIFDDGSSGNSWFEEQQFASGSLLLSDDMATAGELGSRSAFVRITLSLSFGPLNR